MNALVIPPPPPPPSLDSTNGEPRNELWGTPCVVAACTTLVTMEGTTIGGPSMWLGFVLWVAAAGLPLALTAVFSICTAFMRVTFWFVEEGCLLVVADWDITCVVSNVP